MNDDAVVVVDEQRITVTHAKSAYKLNEEDLKGLDCLYVRNPHYRSGPQMRLYRVCDLIEVSNRKREKEQLIEDENKEKIQKERLDILTSKDIIVDEITEPFYDYVLGDYLTNKKTHITITSIKRNYTALLIVNIFISIKVVVYVIQLQ